MRTGSQSLTRSVSRVFSIAFILVVAFAALPSHALGQKLTTTTEADDKYGEGGTHEKVSTDKYILVKERWKDKDGNIREVYIPSGDGDRWEFYLKGNLKGGSRPFAVFDMSVEKKGQVYFAGGEREEWERSTGSHTKEQVLEWIAKTEKQFAKDGTILPVSHFTTSTDEDLQAQEKTPPAPDKPAEKRPSIIDDLEKTNGYFDIGLGYQYMRAPDEAAENLHGGNVSAFYFPKSWIGVGGEFNFLFGSKSETSGTTHFDDSLRRNEYLFGAHFNVYAVGGYKGIIFTKSLVGVVHDRLKLSFGPTNDTFSANAFALSFRGGLDVRIKKRVAIRAFQFDYTRTHFGGEWQNNYGVSAGVVFRFGGGGVD